MKNQTLATPSKAHFLTAFQTLAEAERDHVHKVLAATNGQVAGRGGGGEIPGLHPNTLRSRMKRLGISVKGIAASRREPDLR